MPVYDHDRRKKRMISKLFSRPDGAAAADAAPDVLFFHKKSQNKRNSGIDFQAKQGVVNL